MQDETGYQRWNSKLEQHRSLRMNSFIKGRDGPISLYESITEYNGALIEDWIRIFEESWDRNPPLNAKRAAEREKSEISSIIAGEEALINEEILKVRGDPAKYSKDIRDGVTEGRCRLAASCQVLKYKAFSAIDNQRAERTNQLWKEGKAWAEILLALLGAAVLVIQTSILKRQTAIQEKQEHTMEMDRNMSAAINSSRLRHRIWEILDMYPKSGKAFSKLQPWEKRSLFEKFERLLREEELNPRLAQDQGALEYWRKAVSACRDIQSEHVLNDDARFQERARTIKNALESILKMDEDG